MSVLSIVVPSFNEGEMIEKTAETISIIMENAKIEYEIIFIDDGSTDGTWEIVSRLGENNHRIAGISFSRNFGKESAILAGLSHTKGDAVAIIDCDLQQPPPP
ncbi:MAG: glycosyltransferase, partial [Defluviitaleaceae bacterium]|nr:glycosyltransferase [Defluviitaleaceae bacterium]